MDTTQPKTVFPYSPVIDAEVDEGIVADIAEEALQAFFKVVCERLDDYYPGTHTSGDTDPLFEIHIGKVADDWVRTHATNNPVVAQALEENYADDYGVEWVLDDATQQFVERPKGDAKYVVATCHGGTDWCVREATDEEMADDVDEKVTLTQGRAMAARTARDLGSRWFDFTLEA